MNYKKFNDRRELILNTAFELFADKGYENVNIIEIAKKVGCSHSLIYHHFETKEDIYKTLIKEIYEKEKAYLLKFYDMYEDPVLTLNCMCTSFKHILEKDWDKKFAYGIYIFLEESEKDWLKGNSDSIFNRTVALVKEGQRHGEFLDLNPYLITEVLSCSLRGLMDKKLHAIKICDVDITDIVKIIQTR